MSKNILSVVTGNGVTVYLDNRPHNVDKSAPSYNLVMDALRNKDETALRAALNLRATLVQKLTAPAGSKVQCDPVSGTLSYDGRDVDGLVKTRIFDMIAQGLDVQPMFNFLQNLFSNPSKRAVDELFGFLEVCKLPITSDGCFLAYKRVRNDYKDVHSGTLDNSVGNVLSMPRNAVDDDRNRTCSAGLHFCSYDYLKHFSGERIMVLKINPADVVSIPADYNDTKGRTWRYEVVDELLVDPNTGLPIETIRDGYDNSYDKKDADVQTDSTPSVVAAAPKPATATAQLTKKQVADVRKRLSSGKATVAALAREYGVSSRTIGRVRDAEGPYAYM